MSRRTAEASRAIREAWEKELLLVLDGKGTRDWTPEQQQDIIDKGKAYDADGKAFEGHHMKSAEEYSEYQGCADNIQFLTRSEHKDAHGGSYRNPTNGCYDPITGITKDFGENSYEACEIICLSKPIVLPTLDEQGTLQKAETTIEKSEQIVDTDSKVPKNPPANLHENMPDENAASVIKASEAGATVKSASFGSKVINSVVAAKGFFDRHPGLTEVLKWVGAAVVAVGADAVRNSLFGKKSSSRSNYDDTTVNTTSFSIHSDDNTPTVSDDIEEPLFERNYPDERSSPVEHNVSEYDRQQNGKTVHVRSYKRGGKNSD